MRSARLGVAITISFALFAPTKATAAELALDYQYYKSNVEPIFMKKREGHARCFVCHIYTNNAFRLQRLPDHAKAWTDDASRKNFALASAMVTPGNPDKSHLLMYPLAPEAGGSTYHSGGRQFANKNDPDWKIMAEWVNGAKK